MVLTNITVGIDGSGTSLDALAWSAGAARLTAASLRAIHVWSPPAVSTSEGPGPSAQERIRQARDIMTSALSMIDLCDRVDSVIVQGRPGPRLAAEASGDDLLVVGRRSDAFEPAAEFGGVLVGSTARYCVNHAATPVAAVPAGSVWTDAPDVIVGIDGSATSLAALRWAAAALPGSATLHAVHAMIYPVSDGEIPADYELLDPLLEANKSRLRELVAEETAGLDRDIRSHVLLGSAQDILLNPGFAYDVVVLGEHGETGAAGVIGSVADHTLRHAKVPLIVVPSTRESAGVEATGNLVGTKASGRRG